jgi:serine/threonine-protein kinase
MGVFFKALDTRLDRTVGIKTLHTEFSVDSQLRERFVNEAKALAKLNHPNICVLHDFFEEQDKLFIVMEYIEGETLADLARRIGAIPADKIIPVFRQILLALDYAHRKSIIHRDIKPSNIMLSPQGVVKVMDFGIAKIVGSSKHLTMTGRKVGSIPYMSPEQITQKEIDHRSDLYSLGVTLYQLCTGRVPFDSTSDFEVMKSHLEDPPPPPRSIEPKIPKRLEDIILKSMMKKPEQRYQTALEMRDALAEMGGPSVRDSVPELVDDRTSVVTGEFDMKKSPASRRSLMIGLAAVVVMAVLGGGAALLFSGGESEQPAIADNSQATDTVAMDKELPPPPAQQQPQETVPASQAALAEKAGSSASETSSGPAKYQVRADVRPSGRFRIDDMAWWSSSGRATEGSHKLEAMGPGFPIYQDNIYVSGDTSFAIDLAGAARDMALGDLRASAKTTSDEFPPCEIYVNGSLEGSVPGFRKELKAGLYEIELRPPQGYRVDSLEYLDDRFRGAKARVRVPVGKRTFAKFYLTKR